MPLEAMPAPALREMVLLLMVSVTPRPLKIAAGAEFPEKVLLLIVSVPLVATPLPPAPPAELPEIVLLLMVSVPLLSIPPRFPSGYG